LIRAFVYGDPGSIFLSQCALLFLRGLINAHLDLAVQFGGCSFCSRCRLERPFLNYQASLIQPTAQVFASITTRHDHHQQAQFNWGRSCREECTAWSSADECPTFITNPTCQTTLRRGKDDQRMKEVRVRNSAGFAGGVGGANRLPAQHHMARVKKTPAAPNILIKTDCERESRVGKGFALTYGCQFGPFAGFVRQ